MKKCKKCQTEIDDKSTKCLSCNTDQRNWFMRHKIITGFIILFLVSAATNSKNGTVENNNQNTGVAKIEPTNIISPTKKVEDKIETINIDVTSQIVKKVDKKYRYFFDIRNNSKKPFEGEVKISLYKTNSNAKLGYKTFVTNKPIEPKLGNSVSFDINSATEKIDGEFWSVYL